MFTITLGHLLERGVCFQRYEALAIAQELLARRDGVPTIDNVQLSSDGSATCINPKGTPRVSDVAALLQALLPTTPGQVPAPLRYTLARGLGAVEAPPFESLDAFSESLARFEAGDRHGIIRALLQRVADVPPVPPRRVVVSTAAVPTVVEPPARPAQPAPRALTAPPPPPPVTVPAVPPVAARDMFASGAARSSERLNWGVALLAIAASFAIGAIVSQSALWQNAPPAPQDRAVVTSGTTAAPSPAAAPAPAQNPAPRQDPPATRT